MPSAQESAPIVRLGFFLFLIIEYVCTYEWKFTLYGVGYLCDEFQPISTSSISLLTIHVHTCA